MGFFLHYVQDTKTGKTYRRRVPDRLRDTIGKREFKRFLGKTEAQVIQNYGKVHDEYELLIETAIKKRDADELVIPDVSSLTEMQLFQEIVERLRDQNLDPFKKSFDPDDPKEKMEFNARDYLAERIIADYPIDPRTGETVDMPNDEVRYVRALYSGVGDRPAPTLEDARRVYIEDRGLNDPNELKRLQRVNLVVKHVREALQCDPFLPDLSRRDARDVMKHMLDNGGLKSTSSVKRYLNDIRAIINCGLKEYDLQHIGNPFKDMNPPKKGPDKDMRRPFTKEELEHVRDKLAMTANEELRLIWRLLEGTGCRLAEVTGLMTKDVVLAHDAPHIKIEWNEQRRLKTIASQRMVPLVGDAFEAATNALALQRTDTMLFPSYGRKKSGPTNASAALMKHVKASVKAPPANQRLRVGVHSLRHNMKDSLREAGIAKDVQDLILGHSTGGIGEAYGGDDARLKVASEAMNKLL